MITHLRPTRKDPSKIAVRVDGKPAGTLDEADVRRLGLAVGTLWSAEVAEAVANAELERKARTYAVNSLTRRPLSRAELLRRLTTRRTRDGRRLSAEAAERIAAEMTRRGLLDDAAYAKLFVTSQLDRKPAGRQLLLAKLRAKRVEPTAAKAAVDAALQGVDQTQGAIALARRKLRTMSGRLEPDAVKRRIYGMLARRGFDPETCRVAVERTIGARADADE